MSVDGEMFGVGSDGARARLTFRSQDDMARYEYTFQQKYRVDQSMGK
ncbi:MAG: hypothetical protein IPM54_12275 [Polyangiaceae bacterium]|nr:hypothetical protein [Polyangiaceae bacterium]